MGDPKRPRRKYNRPKRLFDEARIKEEKNLMSKYGLKNRKEIWIAESKLNKIREQAKKLILEPEKQEEFISRLSGLGLVDEKASIDDVLALVKEKILERRFQTLVLKKKIAKTIKEARQLITHKKIKIGDESCNIPGRLLSVQEEALIRKK